MYVTYHASTSGFRRTRTNRLHSGCSILLQIFGLEDWEEFSITIPFRFLFGLMAWIILSQWYASRERKSEAEPIVRQMEEKTAPPPTTVPEEILDRISVKDGARIHIIPIKEIFYLQACGDYVTLFTTSGQHVKEQPWSISSEAFLLRSSFVYTALISLIRNRYCE